MAGRQLARTDTVFYFYVLKSDQDNKLYFGSTEDVNARVEQHNSGKVTSTKGRRPLRLVYYEAYLTRELAVKREQIVKRSGTARSTIYKRIGE